MSEPGTVVLGVGSPLMGDDGIGVSVVERMRDAWADDPDLALLDGGTWGMRALPYIETADRLLIVDAIKTGGPPGRVVRLEGDAIPRHLRQKLSPHQIELGEVLAVAELRGHYPAAVVALGIEPSSIELRDGLSTMVERAVPELMSAVEDQLRVWNHVPKGREATADA